MAIPTALLVTRNDVLLEDVLRLVAAAGGVLDVAHDSDAALRSWTTAPVVLVGVDQLPAVAARQPVRRDAIHVLGTGPAPPQVFQEALRIGAETVTELPTAESWLVELLTDVADGCARRASTLGVIGGCGGAGASTFAAALAVCAAAPARPALLLDVDPLGGGVDRVAGFDGLEGTRWEGLLPSRGRFSARSLRTALPQRNGLALLTFGPSAGPVLDPAVVREVLSAAQRGNDVVVVDLPRHLDAATAEALTRCDRVLLVSVLTVPAVAAAVRVAARLADHARTLALVTRGRATGVAPEDVARTLSIPLACAMANQRRLTESVELGLGPVHAARGPLARAARAVLAQPESTREAR